jgi:hypothetical protein
MSSPKPSPTRHLDRHQRVILGRAALSGLASLVPVPWLDEAIAESVRTQLLRGLGEAHRVDVELAALEALSQPSEGRLLRAAGVGALALGQTRRMMRRLAASLFVLRRLDEALETYLIGTLFDHYCARHHTGGALDGGRALRLRRTMDRAVREARSDVARALVRDLLAGAGERLRSLPGAARQLVATVRGGVAGAPVQTSPPGTESLPVVEAEPLSHGPIGALLGREVEEAELRLVESGYLPLLLSRFDLAWAAALADEPRLPTAGQRAAPTSPTSAEPSTAEPSTAEPSTAPTPPGPTSPPHTS